MCQILTKHNIHTCVRASEGGGYGPGGIRRSKFAIQKKLRSPSLVGGWGEGGWAEKPLLANLRSLIRPLRSIHACECARYPISFLKLPLHLFIGVHTAGGGCTRCQRPSRCEPTLPPLALLRWGVHYPHFDCPTNMLIS